MTVSTIYLCLFEPLVKLRRIAFSKVSAEKELEEDHLVTNSPIDAEKEDLERRTSELETLYAASINDMNALKLQNDQQIELLRLQDKLILQLTEELDESKSAPPPQQQSNIDLNSAQTNVAEMMKELQELRDWKSSVESGLSTLITQLEADDEKLHALEKEADQVKKTNTAQTEYIDTKVQTLLTQVLHKNEMINKLQQENEAQEKALAEKSSSARSSGRWRGSLIPPASPPPSLPLPPIPTESSRSILSELSKGIEIETALDEAAYYKEFTDQLQERLSISKEIDDLRVWEPSDFDEIQKKIDSETWSLDSDQQRTFWKGVKKRLIK